MSQDNVEYWQDQVRQYERELVTAAPVDKANARAQLAYARKMLAEAGKEPASTRPGLTAAGAPGPHPT
jgi:hypothetical protein